MHYTSIAITHAWPQHAQVQSSYSDLIHVLGTSALVDSGGKCKPVSSIAATQILYCLLTNPYKIYIGEVDSFAKFTDLGNYRTTSTYKQKPNVASKLVLQKEPTQLEKIGLSLGNAIVS